MIEPYKASKSQLAPQPKEPREWQIGQRNKTAMGAFIVIRRTNKGFLVQYTSGPWEGKYIEMPAVQGKPTKTIEGLRLNKSQKEEFLDLFYKEFPKVYDSIFYNLNRQTGKPPLTDEMATSLRTNFPVEFQMTLDKYFSTNKD